MDDETAEIELLEQNLNKTRQISQRMVAILGSFDARLGSLEKSILPLHHATQLLTRRSKNIEAVQAKIDEIVSNYEGIAAEEALVLRGPQPGQLDVYRDAVERLNASIAFKSSEDDSRDTARLVETGAKKLAQLYTTLVAEASAAAGPTDPHFAHAPFPSAQQAQLAPLVAFLRTLPVPATHPSHPAGGAILAALKDSQRGYADMRGAFARRCIEPAARRALERAEKAGGATGARELGQWADDFLSVVEEEYKLLVEFAPITNPALITATYSQLLAPLGALFGTTAGALSALLKRSLHTQTFLALAAFDQLSALLPRWDAIIGTCASRREHELRDAVFALRAACVRSFPEFLADLKMAGLGPKSGEMGTGIADFTITTVEYLNKLPEVKEAAGIALLALGDGNWKMGEGMQVAKGPKLGEGDEAVIFDHYIHDVVSILISTLTTLSRSSRRPAFGSVFLLNNMSHLVSALSGRAGIGAILPKPTRDFVQSNFRTAKAAYYDSNFSPLMQALADDRERGKSAMKEKLTRFFDLLEEVTERHRMVRVLEEDEDGRETLADEVVKLVVPSLQRFTQKTKEKEFSRNPQKYIKMSAEAVEAQIRSFYA